METSNGHQAQHSIGAVARQTGLSEHRLRAWERRYGAVRPVRTSGGQRLYTGADILRLRLLRRVADRQPIGRVATRSTAELAELVAADRVRGSDPASDPGSDESPRGGPQERFLSRCVEAASRLDGVALHGLLSRAVLDHGVPAAIDAVIAPLLRRVGALWHEGVLSPAEEHVASVQVRRVLDGVLDRSGLEPDAPVLVATTPSGARHEFGAMMAAVMGAVEGYRAVYLGPSLPAEDIVRSARASGAVAVALSAVYVANDTDVEEAVGAVARELAGEALVVAGGTEAVAHREALVAGGVAVVSELEGLRAVLRAAHATGAGE